MHYLIEHEYVGPDRDKHRNNGHYLEITDEPPRTNQSHEVLTEGWLGTTSDWSETAHGEYPRLAGALAAAQQRFELGEWTEHERQCARDHYDDCCEGTTFPFAETRYAFVSADDWCGQGDLEITAETTDDELTALTEQIETEAGEDTADGLPYRIVGVYEYLYELREQERS